MITTERTFQGRKTIWKSKCIPIKWQLLYFQRSGSIICVFIRKNGSKPNLLSRLERATLLDSGAYVSVLIIPNYTMITRTFNICNHDQHDTSKTLTFAKFSEAPKKQYTSIYCFSSKETKPRYFMIAFVVADFEIIVLGTPFFEKKNREILSKISSSTSSTLIKIHP